MKVIPTRSDIQAYEQKTELDGIIYTLNFHYNKRSDLWSVDLQTSEGDDILMGVPLHVVWDLIGKFHYKDVPPGVMFAFNLEEEFVNPTEDDLGTNVLLLYEEEN